MVKDPKNHQGSGPFLPKDEGIGLSYEIDFSINMRMDFNLACELADLIIESKTRNRAMWSFAQRIKRQENR